MPSPAAPRAFGFPLNNRILASLPKEDYARLSPDLSHVRLPKGRVIWEAGDKVQCVYFLTGGMVSLLSVTGEGAAVEVGMIGDEGLAGISALLGFNAIPYRVVVQLPAAAMRVGVGPLKREFTRGGRLQELILRYLHTLLTQVSQSASCQRFHTTEERLARWLLTTRDRAHSDTLQLTQAFLSQMIGVPRTSVTSVAIALQRAGLISYRRGVITVLDGRGLERASCECYRVISEGLSRYLAA